jgi:hypothetical protein
MLPLIYPLLAIFGIKAATEENGMPISSLVSLLSCAMCLGMSGYGIMKMPIKTPPMMIAMLVCCCCSSSSTGAAVKDIRKKVGI